MGRESLYVILARIQSEPGFARDMYHDPVTTLSRYSLTAEEKEALLSGSVSALERCYGSSLNPRVIALLERYRWEGPCERREATMRGTRQVSG